MNADKILETIEKHYLSVRRIPLQKTSVYEGHHLDRYPNAEVFTRIVRRRNTQHKWESVEKEFIRVVSTPKNAGFWMVQSLSNTTNSRVTWSSKDHYLAPTLGESVQAFLDGIE